MYKSLTRIAVIVLALGLAACGGEEPASSGAASGKDTPAGCLAAVKKVFAEASDAKDVGDEPPPECDELSPEQQQEAVTKAIDAKLSELDSQIENLDDATKKQVRDALRGTPTP